MRSTIQGCFLKRSAFSSEISPWWEGLVLSWKNAGIVKCSENVLLKLKVFSRGVALKVIRKWYAVLPHSTCKGNSLKPCACFAPHDLGSCSWSRRFQSKRKETAHGVFQIDMTGQMCHKYEWRVALAALHWRVRGHCMTFGDEIARNQNIFSQACPSVISCFLHPSVKLSMSFYLSNGFCLFSCVSLTRLLFQNTVVLLCVI